MKGMSDPLNGQNGEEAIEEDLTLSSTLSSTLMDVITKDEGGSTEDPTGGIDGVGGLGGVNVEQKLFLVMSVALATVCFFTNALQLCVLVRDGTIRTVKNLLLISQAFSGLVAVTVVAFPIQVISARGGLVFSENGFNACYFGHSAVILLTMFTSLSNATLLILDYHLHKHHQEKYIASGSSLMGWAMAVTVTWIWAAGIAVLPFLGWNSWQAHDARCHLSTLWPISFATFITFLVAVHAFLALLMYVSGRTERMKAKHRHQRLQSQGQAVETEQANESDKGTDTELRIRIVGWLVSAASVGLVLGHVVLTSSCAVSTQCMQSARHYHEDASSLPWSTLLLTTSAAITPLLYVFSDDNVSASTLQLLTRLCCTRKTHSGQRRSDGRGGGGGPLRSNNAMASATAVFHGGEGGMVTTTAGVCSGDMAGSYVTGSDTQNLVGDTQ